MTCSEYVRASERFQEQMAVALPKDPIGVQKTATMIGECWRTKAGRKATSARAEKRRKREEARAQLWSVLAAKEAQEEANHVAEEGRVATERNQAKKRREERLARERLARTNMMR